MSELSQNRGRGWLMVARVTVEAAAAFFITASLMDYGVRCSAIGSHIAQLQILPAALGLSLAVIALWLGVTLFFGRIYCSTVCPLGALIDLGARMRPERKPFRYQRPRRLLPAASFLILLLALTLNAPFARAWLEPYGLYASLVNSLTLGSTWLAAAIATAIVAALAIMAYRRGRLFCNTLCPIAAPLGFVGRHSAFHIDINTDLCTQCRRCADACKAQCINLDDHVADMSRCVVCFNCLAVCPDDAIAYTLSRHTLSTPMMQKIKDLKSDKSPTLACNNTSNSCATSSKTEPSKPTAPEPEH